MDSVGFAHRSTVGLRGHAACSRGGGFTFANDVQEQIFHRCRWVVDRFDVTAMPFDDLFDLFLGRVVQSAGVYFGDVLDLQQVGDASEFLQFALMKNGNAVTNILDIGQLVAAKQDGFALVSQGDESNPSSPAFRSDPVRWSVRPAESGRDH